MKERIMKTLRKILVVDDDPVVGRSFDRVLTGWGYAVVTARDGDEALRKIAAEEYDVVFTDIRMPGMDGIAVAEHIRDRQPWLPVVIVSGYATAANEARARAAGVSAVLHKPLSPEMIEAGAQRSSTSR
jgi:CheY-like chemotaxis protein